MRVHHRVDVGPRTQHLGMDEHLVVARHRAVDLAAAEVDRDDVVGPHLLEPDAGRLHQEAPGLVGQADRHMAGDIVALAFQREHAARVDQPLAQRLVHLTPP